MSRALEESRYGVLFIWKMQSIAIWKTSRNIICLVHFDTFATQDVTEKQLTAQLKREHELQKQTGRRPLLQSGIWAVAALERYSSFFTTSHKPVELKWVQTDWAETWSFHKKYLQLDPFPIAFRRNKADLHRTSNIFEKYQNFSC